MKKIFFVFLLLTAISLTCLSAGGLSEEIHTIFKAGPGYEIDDTIYFLITYKLYRAPEGLRRFPDGGQSRAVYTGSYILEIAQDRLIIIREYPDLYIRDIDILFQSRQLLGPSARKHTDYDMTFTNGMVRRIGPAAIGLPSPLAFCGKKRKEYLKDIVDLNGDFQYRKEIIRTYITSREAAQSVLDKMDDHASRLDEYKQTEYRIYSEDTRNELLRLINS